MFIKYMNRQLDHTNNITAFKYEYSNITKLVRSLDIINDKYFIIKIIKTTNKKGSYIIADKIGKKYFLKAKLKDFVTENELNVYKNIKKYPHKNINKINFIYETKKFILILSEFIEGCNMTESECLDDFNNNLDNIFVQLLEALIHLHSLEISHCDIKPSNIMIHISYDSNICTPILVDFDFARFLSDNNVSKNFGSIGFIPPEVHNGHIHEKTDAWELAMTFYFYIFKDTICKNGLIEIQTNDYHDVSFLNMSILTKYSGKHKNLVIEISKMLNTNCSERPEMSTIISRLKHKN